MTTTTMAPLADVTEIDRALADSSERPVLIFKHSPTCGISAQAYGEIESLMASLHAHAYLVNVWTARTVSNALAARLHTRHESPQVLLVRDGRVVWSASHFRVTAHAIRSALIATTA
jgi:bacillithiol system protein YtxJ